MVDGTTTTLFFYDGRLTTLERNATSTTTRVRYTRTLDAPGGIGGLLSQTRGSTTSWIHYQGAPGNVTHLTSSTGTIAQTYSFDAFGNLLASSGSVSTPYRFQTKETHLKSKLVYFGARWYDPAVGRWTTPDPLGFVDGPNLYIYLQNNPVNDLDAWGLCGGPGFFGWVRDWLQRLSEIFTPSAWGSELRRKPVHDVGQGGGGGGGGGGSASKVRTDPGTAKLMVERFKGGETSRPIVDRQTGRVVGERTESRKVIRYPHSDRGTPQQHWNLEDPSTGSNIHIIIED